MMVFFALIIILHDRKRSSSDTFTSLIVQLSWLFWVPVGHETDSKDRFRAWRIQLRDTCFRFLEESITFQLFCIICVMLLVLCTVGAQRWTFFKEGRGQAAPPNRREEAKQHHPKGPPRRQFSKKPNHKKKHLPKIRRRSKVGSLLNDANLKKSNDQCKLPCRDCWVSALFVWWTFSVVVCKL